VVHLKNKTTGLTTSTLVQVDLDGSGANDTTLNSLQADLDAIPNISATIQAASSRRRRQHRRRDQLLAGQLRRTRGTGRQ
jgi:hypothetical protein